MSKYNNKFWEPLFWEISPILARAYFSTDIGFVQRIIAKLIFKKLDWLEQKSFND